MTAKKQAQVDADTLQARVRELELALLTKNEEVGLLRSMLEESRLENSKLNQTLKEKDQLLASFSNNTVADAQDRTLSQHEATMFGAALEESSSNFEVDILQKGGPTDGFDLISPKLTVVESPRLSGEEIAFRPISDIPQENRVSESSR